MVTEIKPEVILKCRHIIVEVKLYVLSIVINFLKNILGFISLQSKNNQNYNKNCNFVELIKLIKCGKALI